MTQSHLLVTGFATHRLRRSGVPVRTGAVLWGAVLPDVPLFVLTAWFFLVPRRAAPAGGWDVFGALYDRYFFAEPLWIVAHNTLHAPLILALLFAAGVVLHRRGSGWGTAASWFAVSAALHTLMDVGTHREDGPLLLFPLDWTFRVRGPVSYWDPRYGGDVFFGLELGLDLIMVAYFVAVYVRWRAGRQRDRMSSP
jgi:hypothetical protein